MCTTMIALVRGVIRVSISAGRMHCVAGSQSQRTGVAPTWQITFTVAQKVIAVVTTSSPGPTSSASSDRWSAAVAELTATPASSPR